MATRPADKIRKVPTDRAADFDEQLWPVNAAIIILAGFLVGIVCSQGSFDSGETAFFESAYVHLGIVALLIGTLIWAVTWLRGQMVRRVQFCVLFSVLVHLGLAIYLHGHYLQLVVIKDSANELENAVPDERITVPDYLWHYPDQPQDIATIQKAPLLLLMQKLLQATQRVISGGKSPYFKARLASEGFVYLLLHVLIVRGGGNNVAKQRSGAVS